MKHKIELSKFADGRLMLKVRFRRESNFRFEDNNEATWVPTFEEVNLLRETLDATNDYNEKKKTDFSKNIRTNFQIY
jgi:hypothetical protein